MKLYSNKIGYAEVRAAFTAAREICHQDIYPVGTRAFRPHGPERNGVEFYAESRHGKRATGHRAIGSCPLRDVPRAASWTAYGYVISCLFAHDPGARIGPYQDRADFVAKVTARVPRGESSAFLTLAGKP